MRKGLIIAAAVMLLLGGGGYWGLQYGKKLIAERVLQTGWSGATADSWRFWTGSTRWPSRRRRTKSAKRSST